MIWAWCGNEKDLRGSVAAAECATVNGKLTLRAAPQPTPPQCTRESHQQQRQAETDRLDYNHDAFGHLFEAATEYVGDPTPVRCLAIRAKIQRQQIRSNAPLLLLRSFVRASS